LAAGTSGALQAENMTTRRESVWANVGGGIWDYTLEKIFTNTTGSLSLSEEFVSAYDDNGRYTFELYHPVRIKSTALTSSGYKYFYTKYAWNGADQVYMQQDFGYNDDTQVITDLPMPPTDTKPYPDLWVSPYPIPVLGPGAWWDGAYCGSGVIQKYVKDYMKFNQIGERTENLETRYDDQGNIVLDLRTYFGSENERIEYRYDSSSREISRVQYLDGKNFPYERTETRYSSHVSEGVEYEIHETFTYKSDAAVIDTETNRSALARSISRRLSGETASFVDSLLPKAPRSHHAR
jgi:hypothetical protein